METTAIILSTVDGGNFAVVNIKDMDRTQAEIACVEPLEEEFGETVVTITFDDFDMLDITGETALEVETDEGIRVIGVERTWIY